jgi:hypothetical protein
MVAELFCLGKTEISMVLSTKIDFQHTLLDSQQGLQLMFILEPFSTYTISIGNAAIQLEKWLSSYSTIININL